MKASDWEDYALFAHVARLGGLAAAAEATGVSSATLSRRMRAFEERMGRRLFVHGSAGYRLTADGRALWDRTRAMEAAAVEIDHWRAARTGPVPVRISAGTWTALYLAERLSTVWNTEATWTPEFVHAERKLDVARREIDIGLRNAAPDQPWLAGQRVATTHYAVYGRDTEVHGWIGAAVGMARTASAAWIEQHHGTKVVTRANSPVIAAHMARAGIGRTVLPMFAGEKTPGLVALSPPIDDLTTGQWLVSHQDARHDPPVRAALDALATLFSADRPTGAGSEG